MRLDSGEALECVLKGRSTTLACGDRVRVARVAGGGSIEGVEPRSTLFYRSDAFNEKLIAANVTQVIGVVAPDLAVDEELVNRWIIAAEAQACRFVLVANKSDKPDFAALLARLEPFARLGYAVVPMSATHDVAPLLPLLRGQRTVLDRTVGDGQVDDPECDRTGCQRARRRRFPRRCSPDGTRRRSRRSTRWQATSAAGWVVDSPGLKVFGFAHVAPEVARATPSSRSDRCSAIAGFAIAATIASRAAPCRRPFGAARSPRIASRCCTAWCANRRRCAIPRARCEPSGRCSCGA